NTIPKTTTRSLLGEKFKTASEKSLCNYSFYIGATNDNLSELLEINPSEVCGIKVFMGSSTGNMLVDKENTLIGIFKNAPCLVAVHCEDESIIRRNTAFFRKQYGEDLPVKYHPMIRNEEACFISSSFAVELAKKYDTRLHILHISTGKELELFDSHIPHTEKRITSEVCIHHLWFDEKDYDERGNYIKWNPAIKTSRDKEALFEGVLDNSIDIIATDHAPHTMEEKENTYFKAPSGGPMVQHSLVAMLEFYHQGKIGLEKIVDKMCHIPADIFKIDKRGYLREGYWADLCLADLASPWKVSSENILYKCGWSPFTGLEFHSKVTHTFVNGNPVYQKGEIDENPRGMRLEFNR
ncbi:MAG: dihydroorotase, partial [Bacteroidales bacterium]